MKYNYLRHLTLGVSFAISLSDSHAMDNKDADPALNPVADGKLLREPAKGDLISFPWSPDTAGTVLNLSADQQLNAGTVGLVGVDGKSIEATYLPFYNPLANDEHPDNPMRITPRFILEEKDEELRAPSLNLSGYRVQCNPKIFFIADDALRFQKCLFRANSSQLNFVGKRLEFACVFVDGELANTKLTFFPHASLNSKIEYIQCIPKKSPALLEGMIDFTNFSIKNFMMSNSDVVVKLK